MHCRIVCLGCENVYVIVYDLTIASPVDGKAEGTDRSKPDCESALMKLNIILLQYENQTISLWQNLSVQGQMIIF